METMIKTMSYAELKAQKETLSVEVETLTTEIDTLVAKKETTTSSLEQLLAEMQIREEAAKAELTEAYVEMNKVRVRITSATKGLLEMGIDPEPFSIASETPPVPTSTEEGDVSGESDTPVESETCATPSIEPIVEEKDTVSNPYETLCETSKEDIKDTDIHSDVDECPEETSTKDVDDCLLMTPLYLMMKKRPKPQKVSYENPTTGKRMTSKLYMPFYKLGSQGRIPKVIKLGNLKSRYNYPDPDESRIYSADGLAPTITRMHSDIQIYISPRYCKSEEKPSMSPPLLEEKVKSAPSKSGITKLIPLVPYIGGKTGELKYILPALPETFENYYEPFVGGGAVLMKIEGKKKYANDLNKDIISLYEYVATSDGKFLGYLEAIHQTWKRAEEFAKSKFDTLHNWYDKYLGNEISKKELKQFITTFCNDNQDEILDIVRLSGLLTPVLLKNTKDFLFRKMEKLYKDGERDMTAISQYMEVAIKQGIYNNYRYLFNDKELAESNPQLHTAMYQFTRYYSFSGLEHYNKKGEFNTPYGANPSYNAKSELTKLKQYKSEAMIAHLNETEFCSLDYLEFLRRKNPTENDFIFLDPPYDCVFTRYSNNDFVAKDHNNLANYLLNECRAKWMMVIGVGKTDYITKLYRKEGIYIYCYDKEYSVNLKKRNNRKMTHLMITNYKLADGILPLYEVSEPVVKADSVIEELNMAA